MFDSGSELGDALRIVAFMGLMSLMFAAAVAVFFT
jgi:hypothetical protein